MQAGKGTKTSLQNSFGSNAEPGHFYFAQDVPEYGFGAVDNSLVWLVTADTQFAQAISDTDTVALSNDSGTISAVARLDAAADNILTSSGAGLSMSDGFTDASSLRAGTSRQTRAGGEPGGGAVNSRIEMPPASIASWRTSRSCGP